MFTGIVDGQGRLIEAKKARQNMTIRLRVPASFSKIKPGASISVDGVCLTVTRKSANDLFFDLIPETLKKTHFSNIELGERVNLERALVWGKRLDGHLVQGHVDGTVQVVRVSKKGPSRSFCFKVSKNLRRYLVEKGSAALNGISLTLGKVYGNLFWVHGIPLTLRKTNMRFWKSGKRVNIEVDYLSKTKARRTRRRAA